MEDRPWRLGEFQAISTHATVEVPIEKHYSVLITLHAGGSSLWKRQGEAGPCCSRGEKTEQSRCARTEYGSVAFTLICCACRQGGSRGFA